MAEAVVYILQYEYPSDFEVSELQTSFSLSSTSLVPQINHTLDTVFSEYSTRPAQNPMPRGGGFPTADRESFSDSPGNSPDMLDSQRFAYGRPTSPDDTPYEYTFGSLEDSSGVLLSQKQYAASCTSCVTCYSNQNDGHILQHDITIDSASLVVQNIVQSTYEYVNQFAFLLLASPIPYSIKNPVESDVFIRLANHSVYPLASGTVSLTLNNEVKTGLGIAPFYTGYGGVNVTWTNDSPFDYGEKINVHWEIFDTASPANKMTFSYWFKTVEDKTGPRILNRLPSDDSTNINISSSVSFDIVDYEAGIDISSLELYVNNILINNADTNLAIVSISDGYRIQYSPPTLFLYGDTIPVVVRVSDSSANSNMSFFVWSFSTEGSIAPILTEMDPSPCAVNVERIGNISFEVIDGGHGLDRESITMGINGAEMNSTYIIPIVRRFE
jgi:hypothetical protein